MIQPVLHGGESIETDLSVFLNEEESSFDAYIGVALLERVPISPEALGHKMLVGRLYNAGVKQCDLRKSFGHDGRTIRKWGEALKSGDIDVMVRTFAGRGYRKKATPELIRYARQLYRNRKSMNLGKNYREVIISMVEEVFSVTISSSFASAIFQGAEEGDHKPPAQPSESSTCRDDDAELTLPLSISVQKSPIFPFESGGNKRGILLHHAGLVLFGFWLRLFTGLERQIICQILQGAVNIEQSKSLCHDSLARFSDVAGKGLKTQRDLLEAQATPEAIMEVCRHNARLIPDGPNNGDLYYFDPHVKEYTGNLDLLKGWCGRRHCITKAVNLDTFHTRSGRACFIGHYDPYYDMRERFFMSLELFDKLFDEDKRQGRTFIIDRAIYGKVTFDRFDKDYLITWEKNYNGTGWDSNAKTITFERQRTRNHAGDLRTYLFECQESHWQSNARFRRILVKATNPNGRQILVSILSNHPTMNIHDIVWEIFRRWVQENDFKNLDLHYGINQLDSRASFSYETEADSFEDRPVDSPEYKELKAQVKSCDDKFAKRLLKLRREETKMKEIRRQKEIMQATLQSKLKAIQSDMDYLNDPETPFKALESDSHELRRASQQLCRAEDKVNKRITDLKNEIGPLEAESEQLSERLVDAIRKESRLSLLISGNYRFLDLRRKAYMDSLRVTASNLFKNLLDRFRPLYSNHRDDHVRLRMLTHCSGFLNITSEGWKLQLWLPGTLQPHIVKTFQSFADELSAEMEQETTLKIRIEMLTGPIECAKAG